MRDHQPHPLLAILATYLLAMVLTLVVAIIVDAPFSLWFSDTPVLLLAVLVLMGGMAIVWDGLLVSAGLICEISRRGRQPVGKAAVSVESVRRLRFFTCGPSPLLMIVMTALVVIGTSNITLISLKLLGSVTHWRDPYLWKIEGPIIEWLTQRPFAVTAWDQIYHSCWGIELFAAFVLVLIGRGPRIVLHYCLSLILLFYIGRFLGVINPVMGPALFRPELFGYLAGSTTDVALRLVSSVMSQPPELAVDRGGILLGGVSAMPSLHVAMVAVTAYWLYVAKRWTLWITVPWVLLVWTSTVVLGWHYLLDGAAGILLGAGCIWITYPTAHRFLAAAPQHGARPDATGDGK